MKHTVKIKVVVELTLDATFEDTAAAAEMYRTLEQYGNPSMIRSIGAGRWKVRADGPLRVSVEAVEP